MIGKQLGGYLVIEEIGKGGMATVFRARQLNTERDVAIKVLHQDLDPNAIERFQREARLVVKLEHPHLLPVYDYDGTHHPPYIVMRYMESGTLKNILDQNKLPLSEALFMLRQICSGLDYAHKRGIIHRDLKPANIMVDTDGNVFVNDFGIARVTKAENEGLTQTGFAVGTPAYMSPEQSLGSDEIDQRADVYSLGVMLFQMLTGELPFKGDTAMKVILQHLNAPVPSAHDITPALPIAIDAVIRQAMHKEASQRYQTAGDFAEAVAEVAGNVTYSKAPNALREAAQASYRKLQEKRDANREQVEATYNTFLQQVRSQTGGASQPPMGQNTMNLPTTAAPQVPTKPSPRVQRRSTWVFVALIAFVVVGFGLLGLWWNQQQTSAAQTTATAAQLALQGSGTARAVSNTPVPSETPTITLSPTRRPTDAATPATPALEPRRVIPARLGPGPQYPEIATLQPNEAFDILGISQDRAWYQILLPDGSRAWVAASNAFFNVAGNVELAQVALAPTFTFTPTFTASPTDTNTPTATNTPSITPTLTATSTDLPPTATDVPPTLTPMPTATFTDLPPTLTPTATPLIATEGPPTATPTLIPSPTPLPAGRLPFIADFESSDPLNAWDYDSNAWQVANEGGQNVLIGQGRLSQPMVILGGETPEWLDVASSDFVFTTDFNLDRQSTSVRIVFRYDPRNGYQALEVYEGLVILRRGRPNANINTDRDNEQIITRYGGAPIAVDQWQTLTIWANGNRTFVYVNHNLLIQAQDLTTPQLGPGQILLQVNNAFRPVRFDNIAIQRAEPASNDFEQAGFPPTWQTTSTTAARLATESNGNQYIAMSGDVTVSPIMSPIRDQSLRCRIWLDQGGYQLRMRQNSGGVMLFDMSAGNLTFSQLDAADTPIYTEEVRNFYSFGRWQNIEINLIGDKLQIFEDGRMRYDEVLDTTPPAGVLSFITERSDSLRIDNCLITQAAASATDTATFAFALQQEVAARPYRWLRSDLTEEFDDIFATQNYWIDGRSAAGQFLDDPSATIHQKFLRLTHTGSPTWRLFSETQGVEMFGAGIETRNYNDSTDLLVPVDMRFPQQTAGVAWLGIRSTPSLAGSDVFGYRVELRRLPNGATDVVVRYQDAANRTVLYEGPLPVGAEGTPEWINITTISYQDQIAFYANGRFLTALEGAQTLGGTLALGVDPNTTADFDSLIIRDTTPHGG
jgi:eukaryotic-like serine/threonine-protein kinase